MTLAQAKQICRSFGFTLAREYDEYAIYPRGDRNSPNAYGTDDLDDAVGTAKAMFEHSAIAADRA